MEVNLRQCSNQELTSDRKEILFAPIFIIGAPRSGTTWLQKMMLGSKEIAGGQESEFFLIFQSALNSVKNKHLNPRQVGLSTYWDEEGFYDLLRDIWVKTFCNTVLSKQTAKYLLEKTPTHALHMDEIIKTLPKSKFIHIIRDSRSVVASLLAASKGWGWQWAPSSAKLAAVEWWRCVSKVKENSKKYSKDQYLEVHYEDLLIDPIEEMVRIYNFLEIDFSADDITDIVHQESFDSQKKGNGAGMKTLKGLELKEPSGFVRKGLPDSWKKELSLFQKLVVWRYTRKLMRECGYNWAGRIKG